MPAPFETLLLETPSVVNVKYTVNGVDTSLSLPLEAVATIGQLKVEKSVKLLDPDNYQVAYEFTPLQDQVVMKHLEIDYEMDLQHQVMLAEGFQCWSTTKELGLHSRLSAIPSVVSWITQFNLQGDYDFFNYSGKPGRIHSTGYTYLRNTGSNHIVFFGSLSEASGYTYYKADLNSNKFSLYKDIEGKQLNKGETLRMEFFVAQRDASRGLRSIWEQYADYYDPKHEFRNPRHLTGWSSWYNFYERVTEDDVISSLIAFKQHKYPIDVFQIDDGFEQQIGDWLDVDAVKFPRGMKVLADDIKKQDYIPGIWLAPFAVGFKSKIVKEHPDWLLKHADGSLVVAGPNWGGFYAIDIYNEEACKYLEHVFDEVIDAWGYRLLKLDFIFAAAMIPRLGKSRGEILWDAMDLIVKWTHKRALLLASGVTLPSTWGRFEYSRVSSDASPWWDHSVLRLANVRERVATNNAITSTLSRWAMGSTVFGSDPDVFFVRSNNNKLTKEEKHTLLIINIVFGQLTLMSDNVNLYDKQEHKLYSSIFPKPEAKVSDVVSVGNDVYQANYVCNGREYTFITNVSPIPVTAQLPLGDNGNYSYFFERSNVLISGSRVDWLPSQSHIFLKPHETRTFMKIPTNNDKFMGSTGNIVPGAEIENLTEDEQGVVRITLRKPHMSKKNRIYLKLDSNSSDLPSVYVDGQLASRVERVVWDEHISVAKVIIFE
ncbi:unnamed protein product [Mucor circinelloides]|uniref:alpha-galactosidase n=1 Tax=Mucor circinelloides f. circinelloides (strain 1006PhL) TaxID=1220926 RepID=S2J699_MUCC1|nr:hypothetical protein HMPREF1544_09456 [Mucor circinelloides 1006PhL]